MGLTAPLDPTAAPRTVHPRRQGLPMVLLILLLISVVGTGVSVAAFFVPGAVVSVGFVAVFYTVIVFVQLRRRRARTPAEIIAGPDDAVQDRDLEEIAPDLTAEVVAAERAGLRIGLIIFAPLVVLAVVLAAVFVGWRIIGLGALAFFAIMLFMGGPVWLAAMEEEIDDEGEKIGVEAHRIH